MSLKSIYIYLQTKPAEFTKAAERQEMRKQQLRNYCLEHADETEPGPWDKNQRLEQFLIDDDNKFIYCAVPKAASTPLRLTLIRLKNNSGITITESTVHLPKMWRHLGEYTNSTELPKHLVRHFKFLFVRDPFHRLLSGYRDKFFGKNKRYTNGLRRMIVTAFRPEEVKEVGTETNNVTFTEFLTFILSVSNPLTRDGHWRQIQRLCFPCAFDFDFIGYFETLEEDAAYLLKKAGLDDRVTFPPVRSSKASSDFMTYYSQVPREVIFKLGEAFRSDFEMFGYPFPGPLKSLLGNYANTKS